MELILVIRCEHRLQQFLAVVADAGLSAMQDCAVKRDFQSNSNGG